MVVLSFFRFARLPGFPRRICNPHRHFRSHCSRRANPFSNSMVQKIPGMAKDNSICPDRVYLVFGFLRPPVVFSVCCFFHKTGLAGIEPIALLVRRLLPPAQAIESCRGSHRRIHEHPFRTGAGNQWTRGPIRGHQRIVVLELIHSSALSFGGGHECVFNAGRIGEKKGR